ncbi:MAG: biotin--[acetyl-CoA-carboxylase] ligase [Paramuribaculum sp.]|nr:biotin--[acetyl-CoA-carboxylase] ligase [Paramuribaculum sp.]
MSTNLSQPHIIRLLQGTSSNSILAAQAARLSHGTVISLVEQTAGRGQRGNSWEAAPGQNVTMSMLLRPRNVRPNEQFMLSEMISLAIVEYLRLVLADTPYASQVAIKWPNDIYVANSKICGILIEHSLTSSGISHTIAGIGLNINQTEFVSPAPNPVSLAQLTGATYNIEQVESMLAKLIFDAVGHYDDPALFAELHAAYISCLWRRQGIHPYMEPQSGRLFSAAITGVLPTGHLQLTDTEGRTFTYAFKEVAAIL